MVASSNKKSKSTDLEGTSIPKMDKKQNEAKTSKSGLKVRTPKSGLKKQTPKETVKPEIPKSNEKKDASKNVARKVLAVNKSSKLEKTTSTKKTVTFNEKAGANPPGNKRMNLKRSLSQPGAESVAKVPKLEKPAGTASLESNKKEEAKKKKKRRPMKSSKLGFKEKILGGDIEAKSIIKAKFDALIEKPIAERSKSQRRKIRQFQSWLNVKSKVAADSGKQLTVVGKVQKAAQKKKEGLKVQTQKVIKKEALKKKEEEPQSEEDDDDDLDKANEESSDDGDFEMLFADSRAEEGSDEEDSDIDEEDSDIDEEDSDIDEEDSNIDEDGSDIDEDGSDIDEDNSDIDEDDSEDDEEDN